MRMLSCNWQHFTSEPISRTWLVRHCNSAYNQEKGEKWRWEIQQALARLGGK